MLKKFMKNGCWERRDESKYICRWLVVWQEIERFQYAGAFAGYAGGGTFILERFYAVGTDENVTALWIDFKDVISGNEVQLNDCGSNALKVMEDSLDMVWIWNNHAWWEQTDEVVLNNYLKNKLLYEDQLHFLIEGSSKIARIICEKGGLTAGPSI